MAKDSALLSGVESQNATVATSFYLFNTVLNDFNQTTAAKDISITPPSVYQTKITNPFLFNSQSEWLQILIALAVFILLWQTLQFYISKKFQRQRAEIDKLLYLEQERTRIARDLNDGLGSELFGLKLLGQVALSRKKKFETVNDLEKIVEMAKDISDKVSEIIWVTDINQDSLHSFWNYLQKYMHLLLRPMGMPYYFKSLPTDENFTLSGERRHHLLSFYKYIVSELLNSEKVNGTALFFQIEERDLFLYISPLPLLNWEEAPITEKIKCLNGKISQTETNQLLIQVPLIG